MIHCIKTQLIVYYLNKREKEELENKKWIRYIKMKPILFKIIRIQ